MPDGDRCLTIGHHRQLPIRHGQHAHVRLLTGPRLRVQLAPETEPHRRAVGPRTRGDQLGHPRQDIVGGVGPRDPFGELGQHLVRGRAPPVHNAVRQSACPTAHRLERERDDPRGERGEQRAPALPRECPHADDDRHVHDRDERDECAEHHRLADDNVDVVQAVAHDRDRDRDPEQEKCEGGEDRRHRGVDELTDDERPREEDGS